MQGPCDHRLHQAIGPSWNSNQRVLRFQSQAADRLTGSTKTLIADSAATPAAYRSRKSAMVVSSRRNRRSIASRWARNMPLIGRNGVSVHVPVVLNRLLDSVVRSGPQLKIDRLLDNLGGRQFIVCAL